MNGESHFAKLLTVKTNVTFQEFFTQNAISGKILIRDILTLTLLIHPPFIFLSAKILLFLLLQIRIQKI